MASSTISQLFGARKILLIGAVLGLVTASGYAARDQGKPRKPARASAAPKPLTVSPASYVKGQLAQNPDVELWRLTDDPYNKNHTGYFTEYCWSPDGRYLSAAGGEGSMIFDLNRNEKINLPGERAFWANKQNLAVFLSDAMLCLFDPATKKITTISTDVSARMSDTDCNDEYVYLWGGEEGMVRYRLRENSPLEICGGVHGSKIAPNPFFPVINIKVVKGESGGLWSNLDGSVTKWMNPRLFRGHNGWLGSGEYLIVGDGLVRGRKWNEPYPGNLHILSHVQIGDANGLGFSGRWVVGGGNGGRNPINIADLRSGDGYTLCWPFSAMALPKGTGDQSSYYDSEPKGSPDGTKVNFSSTCDLTKIPYAFAVADQNGRSIKVTTTEGFPDSGLLARRGTRINGCAVISYQSKTSTSFEGVTLGELGTAGDPLEQGDWITAWTPRLIPENDFIPPSGKAQGLTKLVPAGSPLARQRALQLYIAVVRKPDRVWLRETAAGVELLPGENHRETQGYIIYRDGKKLTDGLLAPGTTHPLSQAGKYTAVAVEWSGLVSEPSKELVILRPTTLILPKETPADFSWANEAWYVGNNATDKATALRAPQARMELVHRYDGVIARSTYARGKIATEFHLNAQGRAIRRLFYENGVLAKREIFSGDDRLQTRELFDPKGYIYEQMERFEGEKPLVHWTYEKGEAVKLSTAFGHPRYATAGPGVYQKQRENWVKVD